MVPVLQEKMGDLVQEIRHCPVVSHVHASCFSTRTDVNTDIYASQFSAVPVKRARSTACGKHQPTPFS